MDPSIYQDRWLKLKDSKVDPGGLHELSRQVAFSFMDKHFQRGTYEPAYIDLLCDMATFHSKPELNDIASAALLTIVVERLCDDFEELPVAVYSQVMAQVISHCRRVSTGRVLAERLADFGITSADQLYERTVSTHTSQPRYDIGRHPQRIILLSPVALGADVAILSVMIQRLDRLFPQAEMVIIGQHKLHGLFGGNPHVRVRELRATRRSGIFEWFAHWHAALEILAEEAPRRGREHVLIIDPNSRISRMGALPVAKSENYVFFNTRDETLSETGRCLAERTNDWMDRVFEVSDFCYPTVWIPSQAAAAAKHHMDLLRADGARRIVTVNFGVGGNPRKRVGTEFEKRLLRALVAVPNTVVLLDRGFGVEETERSAALAADMRACGVPSLDAHFSAANFPELSHGVIAVECTIGEMAALIAHSDEHLGYGGAGPHIAAAAGIPTLTIFAGTNNEHFVRRWSTCGPADSRIVHVNTLADPQHVNVDEIVSRIMQERAIGPPPHLRHKVQEVRKPGRRNHPTREITRE